MKAEFEDALYTHLETIAKVVPYRGQFEKKKSDGTLAYNHPGDGTALYLEYLGHRNHTDQINQDGVYLLYMAILSPGGHDNHIKASRADLVGELERIENHIDRQALTEDTTPVELGDSDLLISAQADEGYLSVYTQVLTTTFTRQIPHFEEYI